MRKFDIELTVGLFLIAGIICLGYLSVKLGKMEILGGEGYDIYGLFSNSGGL
jgi:phospholipid/cholesterol/gamma-HCH transport system substrate-binding protein